LLDSYKGGDAFARQTTLTALKNIKGEAKVVVPRLLQLLKDDPQNNTRWQAFDLLGDYGAEAAAAVPVLVEEMRGTSAYRFKAAEALARIDPGRARKAAAPVLRGLLETPAFRVAAASALLRVEPGSKEALAVLQAALADPNLYIRQQVADVLGSAGPEARGAVPALRKALKDESPAVRLNAAAALWRVTGDGKSALPVLVAALKREEPLPLRVQAARKLGEVGPAAKAAVPALLEAWRDPDTSAQNFAAIALKAIDPEAAAKAGVR
jgi:HEAT repeat protein